MLSENANTKRLRDSKVIQFKYYFIILTLFSATWLIANIAAVKLVSIYGITLTGGFVIFPFTTMLSSVIVEVYGYKNSRQAIWAGFILNLTFVFFINIVNIIPSSSHWNLDEQFKNILVPESRIIFASLISFLFSDFSNSYLMAKMKITCHGRSLLKRILISSGLSLSIDITCFMLLAFYGAMSSSILLKLMGAAYVKKIFCQTTLFPLILYLIELLKNAEGVEVYDYDTKFNPFSIDNIYEFSSLKTPFTSINYNFDSKG
jgi:queuosine precursor transporter